MDINFSEPTLFHLFLAFLGGILINIVTDHFNKYRSEKKKKKIFSTLIIIEIDEFLDNSQKILDTFNSYDSIYLGSLQRLHLIRENLNLLSQIHYLPHSMVKLFLNYYIESGNLIENMENNERLIFDIRNSAEDEETKRKLLLPKTELRKSYIEGLKDLRARAFKLQEQL